MKTINKIAILLIAACLLIGGSVMLFTGNAHDGPTGADIAQGPLSSRFAGGDGSVGNPYQISTTTHLQNMDTDLTAYYILINDIDASTTSTWNSGAGFAPVGDDSTDFDGDLDGQGYEITGLFINRHHFTAVA